MVETMRHSGECTIEKPIIGKVFESKVKKQFDRYRNENVSVHSILIQKMDARRGPSARRGAESDRPRRHTAATATFMQRHRV